MKIENAFIDMDGVIVDFMGGLEEYLNVPILPLSSNKIGINILDVLIPDFPNKHKKIDNAFEDHKFWYDLKPYSYLYDMFAYLESNFKEVHILSSPTRTAGCYSGKFAWIEKHLPKYRKKIVLTNDKYTCANSNSILIDDTEDKIDSFRNSGGNTFLFPQPWNYLNHIDDNFIYFKSEMSHMIS